MKIKYKLLIIFFVIISISSIPTSFYILNVEKKERISNIVDQGIVSSKILAQAIVTTLLFNGGNIKATKIDASEMIGILNPLKSSGLIYGDVIISSPNKEINGIVLSSLTHEDIDSNLFSQERLSPAEVEALLNEKGVKNKNNLQLNDNVYQFVSVSRILKTKSYCIGRLLFQRSYILAPIGELTNIVYTITLIVVILAFLISYFISKSLTGPVDDLIRDAEIIGNGDLTYRLKVKGVVELRKISTTINHLTRILQLQIDQLLYKNKELTRMDKLKDEFLENVTYELKTPLFGMVGLGEALLEGISGDLDESAKYNLNLMINSGKRLSTLVNDILDHSQLKNGDIALTRSSVNLFSIFRYIISITEPYCQNKSVKVYTDILADSFYVFADENRLQQILINLVANAIKFTDRGNIILSASYYGDENEFVRVEINDTGIGLDEDHKNIIFNTFDNIGDADKMSQKGYGLGLAITRQLVELHGGAIWVESTPGEGSQFYFTMPKSEKVERKDSSDSQEISVDHDKASLEINSLEPIKDGEFFVLNNEDSYGTIAIIDDEPVNVQVLTNYLSLEGYDSISYSSAIAALDNIEKGFVPDLIVLDAILPEMSGYEFCRKVREKYSSAELPILMLTANNRTSDIVPGFEAGTNDYIFKPINREELIARVKSLLIMKSSMEERRELEIINNEINIARKIQGTLLKSELPDIENFNTVETYIPMQKVGGDFYELTMLDDDKLGVFIADVSGHGIPAAFISTMLKVIVSFYSEFNFNPAKLLGLINRTIYEFLKEQFISAAYAVIDLKKRTITHANAGHWPILIHRHSSGDIIYNVKNSMPFGCIVDEEYYDMEESLEEGDRVFFYTDGILETRNPEKEMFGKENFHKCIKDNNKESIESLKDNLIKQLKGWNKNDSGFDDDLTLIIVEILKFF